MTLIRWLLSKKVTTLLGLVAALIGILTDPQWSGLVPVDWSAMLTTIGGIIAALSRGLVDADGDGIPDILQGRTGGSRLGLLVMLSTVGLGACVLGAWTHGSGAALRHETPAVLLEVDAARADSVVATATCGDAAWRSATAVSTCEWTVTRNGVAVTPAPANGWTTRVAHGGAAGSSATYVISARGRNAAGDVGPYGSVTRTLTVGYPPITAPVITVTVGP